MEENTVSKPLRGKKAKFVEHYTNKLDKDTYKNTMQSALKAGYAENTAKKTSYKLLEDVGIKAELARIEKEESKRYEKSKEDAIIEARANFDKATKHAERKYWYDTWLLLKGWNIQKQEIDQSVKVEEVQAQIADQVRDFLSNEN